MQNKSSMLSSLKQREDAGWIKLHQQLDVDLPVKKDRNKKFFWIFLFTGLGLGGFLWSNRSVHPSTNKSGIPRLISKDTVQGTPDVNSTTDMDNAVATIEENENSNPVNGIASKEKSISLIKGKNLDIVNKNKTTESTDKYNAPGKSKTIHPGLVSSIKPSPSVTKNRNTTKNPDSELMHKEMVVPIQVDSKNKEVTADRSNNNENSLIENKSLSSQNIVSVAYLPRVNSILYSGSKALPMVSIPEPTDFQKTNTLVDLKKSKPTLFFLQGAMALQDAKYLSSSFAPGMSIHLASRWTINTFVGIGYQFATEKGTAINTGNNTSNSNAFNLDISNAAVYSQSSSQIFLDKSNGMTRLSNGTLYISASDQVLYTQAAHFNVMGQTSLAYALSSRWFLESGIYFHKALSKNYNQIVVQSSSLNNNGSLNAQTTASRFNVEVSDIPFDFHFIFQAGYRINKKIDLSLSYAPSSFSTIYPGNNKLYASPSSVPQPTSVSAFVLPNTDGASFARFAIRYHL